VFERPLDYYLVLLKVPSNLMILYSFLKFNKLVLFDFTLLNNHF
jgi:hypothetical protein